MSGFVGGNVIYFKIDDTTKDMFIFKSLSPLKQFPIRPTMLSLFEAPEAILESPEELIDWAEALLSIQKKQK